jgi:hypothetical protein
MSGLVNFQPLVFDIQTILTWGLIAIFSGLVVISLVFVLINRYRAGLKLRLSLNYGLLLVELPKYFLLPKDSNVAKVADEINNFENFLNTLTNLKYPIVFEIATPHFGEEIFFYVAVPKKLIPVLQKSIRSFWPGSEVSLVKEDYNIFNPTGITLGSFVNIKSHHFKPTRTYRDTALSTNDPLDAFLAAFNKLRKEGEGLAYQLIVKPLSSKEHKKIKKVVEKIKQGKSFEEALGNIGREIMESLMTRQDEKEHKEMKEKQKPLDEILVRNLEAKMSKPFFDVNIRLVVSTANTYDGEEILSTLETAFHQFVNPGLNEFTINRVRGRRLRDFVYQYAFRLYDKKYSSKLNTEEIASIFHLPTTFTKSPIIHWLSARSAPPPPNLPTEGIILGENVYQGNKVVVRIQKPDRLRHLYIIGQTGTGKTTLLKNIAEQDMENGDGICFIDPHGDVAQELLGLVPRSRIEDVIYFNPGDPSRPMALNILEYDASFPEQKTFIINTLIEIIDKIYNLSLTGGPMFEQYLRNALLLIMDDPSWGYTLMEVSRVLVDSRFRNELLEKCRNYPVIEFWEKQAPSATSGELTLENMVVWITSKLNPFITNDFVRPIIAQPHSTLNFKEIMDNRKILIVNLAKGKIGETSSYLLGMILIAKILAAAFSRVDQPEAERKDFYLFIDEFQNFAFKGVASILSEARKYRLAMILAHQYIKQLPEEISAAVFGNVGTIISFRIGTEDAEVLERQFTPIFTKSDLLNIPNYNAYLKLLISGYISDPFNIRTLRPTEPNKELAQKMAEISKLKYGRPKEEIEMEIEQKYGYTKVTF